MQDLGLSLGEQNGLSGAPGYSGSHYGTAASRCSTRDRIGLISLPPFVETSLTQDLCLLFLLNKDMLDKPFKMQILPKYFSPRCVVSLTGRSFPKVLRQNM